MRSDAGQQKDEETGRILQSHDKIQQPESEIKQEDDTVPVDSSAAPLRDAIAPEQKKAQHNRTRAAGKSGSEVWPQAAKTKGSKGTARGATRSRIGHQAISRVLHLEQPAQSMGQAQMGSRPGSRGTSGQKTGLRASLEGPAGYSIQA